MAAALRNDLAPERFVCVFLPHPEMLCLHREEEWREWGGLYWETSSCKYCGVVLCTLIGETEDFVLNPFGDRANEWNSVLSLIVQVSSPSEKLEKWEHNRCSF